MPGNPKGSETLLRCLNRTAQNFKILFQVHHGMQTCFESFGTSDGDRVAKAERLSREKWEEPTFVV